MTTRILAGLVGYASAVLLVDAGGERALGAVWGLATELRAGLSALLSWLVPTAVAALATPEVALPVLLPFVLAGMTAVLWLVVLPLTAEHAPVPLPVEETSPHRTVEADVVELRQPPRHQRPERPAA